MRDFSDHGGRLFQPVQILGGACSRAIIQSAPDSGAVNDQFIMPRVTCRVKATSMVKTGCVIQTQDGKKFLVCDHQTNLIWRTHLLLPCDRQVVWERANVVTDAVTGLSKADTGPPTLMGNPWVYWERPAQLQTDRVTRIPDVDYAVATGSPIQLGDTIDGHNIVRFDLAMGVTILGIRT